MDKASVARVCIMFNYQKNIYSLKIFKIMSICCAFFFFVLFLIFSQFSYLSKIGCWDKIPVGLAPLQFFPFLRLFCPFWFWYVCCWPWVSCLEFQVLDEDQGGQVLTMLWLDKGCNRKLSCYSSRRTHFPASSPFVASYIYLSVRLPMLCTSVKAS